MNAKPIAAAVLTTLAFAASAQREIHMNIPMVDLTQPGAMDALRKSNPDRYARVQKELEKVATMPCQYSGPTTIQVAPRFGDEHSRCAVQVYTSFPAKRRASVSVDGTIYDAMVTLTDSGGRLTPAVNAGR